jgi:hypothetical protein
MTSATLSVSRSKVKFRLAGGAPVDFFAGTLESFQLGGANINNMSVIVADFFAMLSAAVGAKLDGIVGYNFLRNYKVVIDYPGETLTLF